MYMWQENEYNAAGISAAKYWKNGQACNHIRTINSFINSIALVGSDVYAAVNIEGLGGGCGQAQPRQLNVGVHHVFSSKFHCCCGALCMWRGMITMVLLRSPDTGAISVICHWIQQKMLWQIPLPLWGVMYMAGI
jgi:hypothetical protein